MEDRDIVTLYWQRDEEAIRQTDRQYGRYLSSIAFHILADREDKVLQVERSRIGLTLAIRGSVHTSSFVVLLAAGQRFQRFSTWPHYLAHQAVDSDFGIIVGQTVTAGDVNDSVPFLGLIEHIHENVCTNSDRYRGRRLRFSAGPSGAGRAGDRLFRAAAEDRRAGKYTVHAGRFSL